MYKLYRYCIVYRVFDEKRDIVVNKELPIYSMYFLDYEPCHSEAVQIMRCPVPSFVKDKLLRSLKDCRVFASAYVVESLYVDDNTYNELLNNKALKGVVF